MSEEEREEPKKYFEDFFANIGRKLDDVLPEETRDKVSNAVKTTINTVDQKTEKVFTKIGKVIDDSLNSDHAEKVKEILDEADKTFYDFWVKVSDKFSALRRQINFDNPEAKNVSDLAFALVRGTKTPEEIIAGIDELGENMNIHHQILRNAAVALKNGEIEIQEAGYLKYLAYKGEIGKLAVYMIDDSDFGFSGGASFH